MYRRPPSSTRPTTLFPYPTLYRSLLRRQFADPAGEIVRHGAGIVAIDIGRQPDLAVEHRLQGGSDGVQSRRFRHEGGGAEFDGRSEEHTSELQSLMRISYAVFCLKKKKKKQKKQTQTRAKYN